LLPFSPRDGRRDQPCSRAVAVAGWALALQERTSFELIAVCGVAAMPSNESFGCFVSQAAVRTTLGPEDLKRLCFSTTNEGDFRGRPLEPDGQMENMSGVRELGKKSNKYMSYPEKRVPNFDRRSCSYSQDFWKKPFGDNEVNKFAHNQLREMGTCGSITTASLPFSRTTHAEDFRQLQADQIRNARQKSQVPPHRYCDNGRLLITKSFSQSMHGAPSSEVNVKGQFMRPSDSLANAKSHGVLPRTTYNSTFHRRPGLEPREARSYRRTPQYSFSDSSLLSATQ